MDNTTVKPSTRLLPMDDIANELKTLYSFSTTDDTAPDTAKVAGVKSNLIAAAATDDSGNLVSDRNTVNNALSLGGKPANNYFTKDDGISLQNFSDNVSGVLSDEIRSLRDELYQMRGELVTQGFLKDYNQYSGFQDLFKSSNVKFEKDYVCGITQDYLAAGVNKILPEIPGEFDVNDYFVIVQTASDTDPSITPLVVVAQVITKDSISGQITFSPAVTNLHMSNTKLYKSLGQYINGSYSFSKSVNNAVTNKQRYTMLNDDTSTTMMYITQNNAGYAVNFKVPNATIGALSKFSIYGSSVNSPGSLLCYVLDPVTGKLVATSSPVAASDAVAPGMIDFDFTPADGKYTILAANNYIFIVTALQASDTDYWQLSFCYHSDGAGGKLDLQTNDINYVYSNPSASGIPILGYLSNTTTMSQLDMYFVLTTNEVVPQLEIPYNQGLYSAKITLPEPIEISRARLTMRINREGLFRITTSGAYPGNSIVYVNKYGGKYDMSQDTGMEANEAVIIGNTIDSFNHITSTQMTLQNGVFINENDPVYRVGYNVQLKAKKRTLNPSTFTYQEANEESVKLPLTAVLKDGVHTDDFHSDRLIFENSLSDPSVDSKYFNEFEIQIQWNSNFAISTLTDFNELIGRIFLLSLTFDKSL